MLDCNNCRQFGNAALYGIVVASAEAITKDIMEVPSLLFSRKQAGARCKEFAEVMTATIFSLRVMLGFSARAYNVSESIVFRKMILQPNYFYGFFRKNEVIF